MKTAPGAVSTALFFRVSAGILATAFFINSQAFAAATCEREEDISAVRTAALQQQLMVAAFTCNRAAEYNAFVGSYRSELQGADAALLAYFQNRNAATCTADYHAFKTKLANISALRSSTDQKGFCARAVATFRDVLKPAKVPISIVVAKIAGSSNAPNEKCARKPGEKLYVASVVPKEVKPAPQAKLEQKIAAPLSAPPSSAPTEKIIVAVIPVAKPKPVTAPPAPVKIVEAPPVPKASPFRVAEAALPAPKAPAPKTILPPKPAMNEADIDYPPPLNADDMADVAPVQAPKPKAVTAPKASVAAPLEASRDVASRDEGILAEAQSVAEPQNSYRDEDYRDAARPQYREPRVDPRLARNDVRRAPREEAPRDEAYDKYASDDRPDYREAPRQNYRYRDPEMLRYAQTQRAPSSRWRDRFDERDAYARGSYRDAYDNRDFYEREADDYAYGDEDRYGGYAP